MLGSLFLVGVSVAAFATGLRLRGGWSPAALVGLVGVGLLAAPSLADDAVPLVMLPVTLWCAGLALRSRTLVAQRLDAQARELDAEREAYAGLAVRYERARIAAELHDVVAHAISVMVVQASAGQRLVGAAPEAADETFRVIGDAARQAEADLGRLAELLADHAPAGPAADLALVEELVQRSVRSGLHVTLRLEGDRDALRGPAAHAASRVVQEGLTNALRYAPGAAVRVAIRAGAGAVEVEVANDPGAPGGRRLGLGSGRGLTGVRERVDAVGGTVEAGDDGAGGWTLRARIPRGLMAAAV